VTMRRAAPGLQVSTGRLRVDAARAIAKLREYQLADRAAWILEGVRAAVASSATAISLDGDANDIWLAWSGPAWNAELLPRLFDELVSPEPAEELQHVRLLAAAVNSALGMDPAYVDVYAIASPGSAQRVRYTPDVLAEPADELGNAPLRQVVVEPAEPPRDAPAGMLVHLRRRVSFEVLGYLFREPPELAIARDHCRDIAVPLTIGTLTLQRSTTTDLVRLPLGDGLDGFIAIVDPARATPRAQLEVAERGVVLVRYPIDALSFEPKLPVPLRVFVDADRLPTNASRSQVRQDIHPISTATRRCRDLVPELIVALAERAGDGGRARHAALQLLAANIGGRPGQWSPCAPELTPLAQLPLVKTATGKPVPLTTAWEAPIYTERSPLDADLEPFLGNIAWLRPDDPAHALLGGHAVDSYAMRLHARFARRQRRAHRQFLAHAKRDLHVKTKITPRVRAPLGVAVPGSCIPDEVFATTRGEVCVYATGRDARLIVLLDGRELEQIEIESPIPFDAVIECALVRPADRYRGVARDEGFNVVNRAMQAGVVRAIEALVSHSDDIEVDDRSDRTHDLTLVRKTHLVAKAHGIPGPNSPLERAAGWQTIGGKRVSLAELRASRAVGVVAPGVTLLPPKDRIIVVGDDDDIDDLRTLLGNRVVKYDHAAGVVARVTPARLAAGMARTDGAPCLHVRDGELVAAIGFTPVPVVRLHHLGKRVQERPYVQTYVRCSISVDSDELIPNDDWTVATHDAGLYQRSYADWELRLLRAVASVIVGDRPPYLEAPDRITFDDDAGGPLARALVAHDPQDVLGPELLAKLRAMPLFARLGTTALSSIDELCASFPAAIPCTEWNGEAVPGFSPLVAKEPISRLVLSLSKRSISDATPELERRGKQREFQARHEAHLARATQAVALPAGEVSVPVEGPQGKGVLGVHAGTFEIRMFVEGRPFAVHRPASAAPPSPLLLGSGVTQPTDVPLLAIVDVGVEWTDETFTAIRPEAIGTIESVVREAIPALVGALVARDPLNLVSAGVRAVLQYWLVHRQLPQVLREQLRTAPAFRSIQGERVSLADAAMPRLVVSTATWADTWLAPGDGEAASALDEPVLAITGPSDELMTIIENVHGQIVQDVTADVARLQARRRMARGLLPTPKLGDIESLYKRDLKQLGPSAAKLGHGEIGLVPGIHSMLLIHEAGVLVRHVNLDVMPAIHLAVEDPHEVMSFEPLRMLAQELALELVSQIVAANVEIPAKFRRSIARGVLASRIPPAVVRQTPLFFCTDGRWLDWAAFQEQIEAHADVWALTALPAWEVAPLDGTRRVILLESGDIGLAKEYGHPVIDAKGELELDAQARKNKAKPRAVHLELESQAGVLASVELEGTGTYSPRGIVAVLSPVAAERRKILVHRAMHPLGVVDDPCKWPTISIVDDARITPVRTWAGPKLDETWQSIAKQVRAASEEALATIGEVPDGVLASLRVTNHVCADIAALRDAPHALIRGVVWLVSVPFEPTSIHLLHKQGSRAVHTPRGFAVGGWVAIHDPDNKLKEQVALEQLCEQTHGKLVRQLVKADPDVSDAGLAHIAHGIALRTLRPTEVGGVTFDCFSPAPLSARSLASLLRGTEPVPTGARNNHDPTVRFVDDGSEVAKVVRVHLGERLFKPSPMTKPKAPPPKPPPAPMSPPVSVQRPAPAPTPGPAPRTPRPPHMLQPLVEALAQRVGKLGVGSYDWAIDERAEHLVRFESHQLVVGGENARLRLLATELAAKSETIGPAVDALAAHAVSVLNLALSEVTDAGESHAIGVLLATPPSVGRPRSHRSS
jgi:hypothetical protein